MTLQEQLAGWAKRIRESLGRPMRLIPVAAIVVILAVVALLTAPSSNRGSVTTGPGATGGTSSTPTGGPSGGEGLGQSAAEVKKSTAGSTGGSRPRASPGGVAGRVGAGSIEIGIPYYDAAQVAAALDALGYSTGASIGHPKHQAELVVNYVNARGGLKFVPVFYEQNPAPVLTPGGRQTQAQSMCSTWTEDNHVFAMLLNVTADESILTCAVDHKTPLVALGSQVLIIDQQGFRQAADYYYLTNGFIADRRERAYVDSLAAQGFFDRGSKVGLLFSDRAGLKRAVANSLKPALAAHGIMVSAEIAYPDFIESPWSNYVLQFQNAGIDHVLFALSEGNAVAPLLFMRAAENQLYRPRYGLGSDAQLASLSQNAPKEQLHRSLALGWIPYWDLSANAASVPPVSSSNATCRDILVKGGEPADARLGWYYCEGLFFLQSALAAAPEITPSGLAIGAAALRDTWPSVFTYGSLFTRDRHDGVSVARYTAFDDACACFKYTSPPIRLP